MTLHKSRSKDTLHHILSSFRQFEKKLDKLQDDVSYHGQTLADLSVMIANLSGGTLYDAKANHDKGVSKTTAMDSFHFDESVKPKRKSLQPLHLPSKVATKSFQDQNQKYGIKPSKEPEHFCKMASVPKTSIGAKRVQRPKKGEAPRKANPLRSKKASAKKSKSPTRNSDHPSQFRRPLF
ncbi:uncharacterized protein LOC123875764 [Maniola jurtina]|uniref:uncharacterized protein LOC123875764 n=1 Tax=Maniola jurtina TaxID=191418 RepID=UPI001E68742C|nr:uncharacterized protein LOC123875764 [Maniola jurtina]